jgi:hypothetical protein
MRHFFSDYQHIVHNYNRLTRKAKALRRTHHNQHLIDSKVVGKRALENERPKEMIFKALKEALSDDRRNADIKTKW